MIRRPAPRVHPLVCACADCAGSRGLTRRAQTALFAVGVGIAAACDAAGLPDPFTFLF